MTESELKDYLEAAEKSPKQIAAAVLGLGESVALQAGFGQMVYP